MTTLGREDVARYDAGDRDLGEDEVDANGDDRVENGADANRLCRARPTDGT